MQSNLHAKTEAIKAKEKGNRRRSKRDSRRSQRPAGPMRLDAADLFRQMDGGGQFGGEEELVQVTSTTLSVEEIAKKRVERKQKRMKEKMARDQAGIASLQDEIAKLEEKLGKGNFAKQAPQDDNDDYLDAINGAGEMFRRHYDGDKDQGSPSDTDDDEDFLAARTNKPATFLTGMNMANAGDSDDSSSCSSATSISSGDDDDEGLGLIIDPPSAKMENFGPSSEVYRRQEKWLAEKERKRKTLIAEKEKKVLEGFTGKPELGSAKESWARAKAAHNAAVEKAKAEVRACESRGDELRRRDYGISTSIANPSVCNVSAANSSDASNIMNISLFATRFARRRRSTRS